MDKADVEWIWNQILSILLVTLTAFENRMFSNKRSGAKRPLRFSEGCMNASASYVLHRGLASLLGAGALLLSPGDAGVLNAQTHVALELVGRWTNTAGTYPATIKVFEGIAYLGYDDLKVLDVRNPSQPTWLTSYQPVEGGAAQRIELAGSVGFVALYGGDTTRGGLHVLDLSDPSQPRRLGHSSAPKDARDVKILGDYVLVADFYSGLHVIDIRNPAAPVPVARYQTAGNPMALAVANGRAYLAEWSSLRIFDLATVTNPQLLGTYDQYETILRDVKVRSSHAFLAAGGSGLTVIDATRPEQPVRVAQVPTGGHAYQLQIVGERIFLAAGEEGLEVFDISNPVRPQRVGGAFTFGPAQALDINGDYAYVVADAGLEIFQLTEKPIGIARQPRSQIFVNDGQPIVLEGLGVSISPFTYQWRKDGTPLTNDARIGGATGSILTVSNTSTNDQGFYSLTVSNEHGTATSASAFVEYRPGLREALDDPGLVFQSRNGDWEWQTNATHDGVDAAQSRPVQSGIVADGTAVTTKVVGPGTLSFWWRVTVISDLSTNPDVVLALSVDGGSRVAVSEEGFRDTERWDQVVADIAPGQHTITWSLGTLWGCTDPARGIAWLDQVEFRTTRPIITRFAPRTGDGGCHLEYQGPPGARLTPQSSTDLVSWKSLGGSVVVVPPSGRAEMDLPDSAMQRAFYRLEVLDP